MRAGTVASFPVKPTVLLYAFSRKCYYVLAATDRVPFYRRFSLKENGSRGNAVKVVIIVAGSAVSKKIS